MADTEKNNSKVDKAPVSFSLYIGNDQVPIDPAVAWLKPHKHFNINALPSKLKRVAGVPESKKMNLYRYSRSSNSYVLLNDESSYNAMLRAIKVKKHLSFCMWDASSRKAVANLGVKPKTTSPSAITESKPSTEDEMAKAVSSFLSSDKGEQALDKAIHKKVESITTSIDEKLSTISEHLSKQIVMGIAQELKKKTQSETPTIINVAVSPPEDQFSNQATPTLQETDKMGDESQLEPEEADTVTEDKAPEPEASYYHSATCDSCNRWIKQYRYKCLWCTDYDLCSTCMADESVKHHKSHSFVKVRFREDIVRRDESVSPSHDGILCDGPCCVGYRNFINGDRYTCLTCDDFDLCGKCANLDHWTHDPTHKMVLRTSAEAPPQVLPGSEDYYKPFKMNQSCTYVARLCAFNYHYDSAYGYMSWSFSNHGSVSWPKGTMFCPMLPEGTENLATPIVLRCSVAPGQSVKLNSVIPLACSGADTKHDYSCWTFKSPTGIEFARGKYYHGMKVQALHILGDLKKPLEEVEKQESEATTQESQKEEADKEISRPERDVEVEKLNSDKDENITRPEGDGEEEKLNLDKDEIIARPERDAEEEKFNSDEDVYSNSESATDINRSKTVTPRVSSSPFISELENSEVKLFTIPTTSQENVLGDVLPDGSQISLSASISSCMSPPNPCVTVNPGLEENKSASETDMFSETDEADDIADDYDVVNASELSDEEA